MELLEKDEEYIISLLEQGKKVEAIVFVKDKTGMSLKEAKDYIDKKANNEYYEENITISKEDEEYIYSLINENKKLQAVAFLHKEKEITLKTPKNEIKEFKNTGNKENITQKELSNNIQKVIEKSSEKWNNTEKEKGEKALDIVRNHLGNNEYSYNLMDKINDNTYMVVVLDSNTREVIRILLFGFRKKYSSKGRIEIE